MNGYIKKLSSAFALLLLGLLIGCNVTSNASDDDSTFATKTALTALQATVTTLQAQVTADEAKIASIQAALPKSILSGGIVPNASVMGRYILAASASTTTQPVGTISAGGFTTTTADLLSSKSYVFRLPLGDSGSVGIGGVYPIYFTDTACSSTPYVTGGNTVSQFAVHQGVVISPSGGTALDYVYLPAGEAQTTITAGSRLGGPAPTTCILMSPASVVNGAYQLLPNDPNVTGVQNSLISNAGIQ